MTVLNLALEFALLVFLGIFIIRAKIVEESFTKNLSRFVMDVALPCMIFNSIRSQSFTGGGGQLLIIMGLAVIIVAALALLGAAVWLISGKNLFGRCVIFSTAFGNYTYVGMAVVQSLFGSEGLFTYTIFTLPVRMVFYAAPSFLMNIGEKTKEKKRFRQLIAPFVTPPVASVLIGLVFYFTGLTLPEFLDVTLINIGGLASTLGMLICGMGLAGATLKSLISRRRPLVMVLVRNLLAPGLVIGVLYLLPIAPEIKQVLAVYGAVPVPSLITAFSIQMNCPKDIQEDCSAAVLLSTLLCIVTLPLWMWVAGVIL